MLKSSLVVACAVLLTGCSPDLGTQILEEAFISAKLPESFSHSRKDPAYLVFRFRSSEDLNSDNMNALYSLGSFCPYSEDNNLPVFGPFAQATPNQRLPVHDERTPHFAYLVYVPIAAEIFGKLENGKTPVIGRYDLRKAADDLCITLEHTGYPWAERTNDFVIGTDLLRRVIRAYDEIPAAP